MSAQRKTRAGFGLFIFLGTHLHPATAAVQVCDNSQILQRLERHGVEQHRTLDATKGKEMELRWRMVAGMAEEEINRLASYVARRYPVIGQFAVHAHHQAVALWLDQCSDVELERQMPAFVPAELRPVEPYCGKIVHRAEAHKEALILQIPGQIEVGLIPGRPEGITAVFKLVVPTGRDSNRAAVLQPDGPALRPAGLPRGEGKIPKIGKIMQLAKEIE